MNNPAVCDNFLHGIHQYWANVYTRMGGKGVRVGWVVAKVKTKEQDNTNSRIWSGYDVHMYPQLANIPLKGLYRHVLIVGTVSGYQCQIKTPIGIILPVMNLHDWQKAFRESRPVDISQWKQ